MARQENILVPRRYMLRNSGVKGHDVSKLLSSGLKEKNKVYRERDKINVTKY